MFFDGRVSPIIITVESFLMFLSISSPDSTSEQALGSDNVVDWMGKHFQFPSMKALGGEPSSCRQGYVVIGSCQTLLNPTVVGTYLVMVNHIRPSILPCLLIFGNKSTFDLRRGLGHNYTQRCPTSSPFISVRTMKPILPKESQVRVPPLQPSILDRPATGKQHFRHNVTSACQSCKKRRVKVCETLAKLSSHAWLKSR